MKHEPSERAGAPPRLTGAEPQLFVADLTKSLAFFGGKLGFSTIFTYGDPPSYAGIRRDAARLNLRCIREPILSDDRRMREELLAASLTVDDADRLFAGLSLEDRDIVQRPRTEPWGTRTFILRDPDGNLLLFAGPGLAKEP